MMKSKMNWKNVSWNIFNCNTYTVQIKYPIRNHLLTEFLIEIFEFSQSPSVDMNRQIWWILEFYNKPKIHGNIHEFLRQWAPNRLLAWCMLPPRIVLMYGDIIVNEQVPPRQDVSIRPRLHERRQFLDVLQESLRFQQDKYSPHLWKNFSRPPNKNFIIKLFPTE